MDPDAVFEEDFHRGGSGVAGAPGAPSNPQYQFQSTYTRTQQFGSMGSGGSGGGGDAEDFELQRALAMSLGAADPGIGAGEPGCEHSVFTDTFC